MQMNKRFHKPPILIGGCGRSGTSLLLSVLSAHPRVVAVPVETGAFSDHPSMRLDLLFRELAEMCIPEEATRWCEKTPRNVLRLAEILAFFGPGVRFLNIVRDGRDVVTSLHPQRGSVVWRLRARLRLRSRLREGLLRTKGSLLAAVSRMRETPQQEGQLLRNDRRAERYWVDSGRWVNDVSAGQEFEDHPQVMTIRYEDLVLRFPETIRGVCDFIDEPAAPEILDWHSFTRIRSHPAWRDSAKPLYEDSIGRWKSMERSRPVRTLMENRRAVALLRHYGYL